MILHKQDNAEVETNADADTNRICTKNNMPLFPSKGTINSVCYNLLQSSIASGKKKTSPTEQADGKLVTQRVAILSLSLWYFDILPERTHNIKVT